MEPQSIRFGGGGLDPTLSPLFAVAMVVAVILMVCLPRKYAIAPLILSTFIVPITQVVILAGVHLPIMRILILVGLGRWIKSGAVRPIGGYNSIDRVFALFAFAALIAFSLQWMEMPAIVKALASFLDALGGYFVLRFLIRDREDVRRVIKLFAIVAIVMAACMINEQINHQNVFAWIAGIRDLPAVRAGKVRSQGSFEVYLTAGAFGATLIPLLVWLWSDGKFRFVACLGIVGATAMTLTSNSSTPLLAYAAAIIGLCFWPFRSRMRIFRRGLALTLIGLDLVMKAPVWALIGRIDLTGSSSSYHRYKLVDNFIRHFSDWWFVGYKNYNNWGWDMWDLSNQFVAYGLTGGLITFVLVIAVISLSFSGLGNARKLVEHKQSEAWYFWCLGAALFSNLAAFFGMSYFDQMQFAWYSLLAIISISVYGSRSLPVQSSKRVRTFWDSEPAIHSIPEPSNRSASIF
jgi:hypothetical protein